MGWSTLSNGLLLEAAENAGFDVIVTADKNLRYQQKLTSRLIALVVVPTNNRRTLENEAALIVEALGRARPGSYEEVVVRRQSS